MTFTLFPLLITSEAQRKAMFCQKLFDKCRSKSSSALVDGCDSRRDTTLLIRSSLLFTCKPSSGMMLIVFSLSTQKNKLSEDEIEKAISINSQKSLIFLTFREIS